jgi:hypothetical protein
MENRYKLFGTIARLLAITGLLSATFVSCRDNVEEIAPVDGGTASFKGQRVRLPKNFPAEALTYTTADYASYFVSSEKGAKAAALVSLSLAELNEVITPIRNKFPNSSSLDKDAIKQIKKDFPGISDEKIGQLSEIIDEYYDKLTSFEAGDILAKKNKAKGGRLAYFGYNVSAAEVALLIAHPRNVEGTKRGADLAEAYEIERYGNNSQFTKDDAFRHSLFGALVAKYGGHHYGEVWKAAHWGTDFTNAHEQGVPDGVDKSMDLHNNAVGIDYFRRVAWRHRVNWLDYDVHAPDDNQFKNHLEPISRNAVQVSDPSQIPGDLNIMVFIQ